MNLSRVNQSIHTKIVRDKSGVDYLVSFLVIESEVGIDVKVISAKRVESAPEQKDTLCLPVCFKAPIFEVVKSNISNSVKSPYFSIDSFFVSQPTRAPSLI